MDRKILAVSVVFSLIIPAHFLLWALFPPEGAVFNGYDEGQAVIYSVMASSKNGFENPWILGGEPVPNTVFSNPSNGPVYSLAIIGLIAGAASESYILVYVAAIFVSGVLFLLAAYKLISYFSASTKESEIIFALFIVSAGISFYFQIPSIISGGLQNLSLVGMGVNAFRTSGYYLYMGAGFAFLSIFLAIKRRIIASSIFLGAAALFYPLHGLISFIIIMFFVIFNYKNRLKSIISVILILLLFCAPWAYFYLLDKTFFVNYYSQNSENIVSLFSVAAGLGISLVFVLYEVYHRYFSGKFAYASLAALAAVLFMFAPFSVWPELKSSAIGSIVTNYYILFELPFVAVLFCMLFCSIKKYSKSEKDFFLIWLSISSLLFFIPSRYTGLFSDRFFVFFYIPVIIVAGKGLVRASARFKISKNLIVIAVIAASLPSMLAYNIYFHGMPEYSYQKGGSEFYAKSEINALHFLKGMPDGAVMSSVRISSYLPFYSGKKSVMYSDGRFVYDLPRKISDYKILYSDAPEDARKGVLERYGIRYVFVGKGEYAGDFGFLKEIYDDGETRIYEQR